MGEFRDASWPERIAMILGVAVFGLLAVVVFIGFRIGVKVVIIAGLRELGLPTVWAGILGYALGVALVALIVFVTTPLWRPVVDWLERDEGAS